jgi:hypothetical protein
VLIKENEMKEHIYSQCIFDVDGRYVDMDIEVKNDGKSFYLTVTDTSNDESTDQSVEFYVSRKDLELIVERMQKVLEKTK